MVHTITSHLDRIVDLATTCKFKAQLGTISTFYLINQDTRCNINAFLTWVPLTACGKHGVLQPMAPTSIQLLVESLLYTHKSPFVQISEPHLPIVNESHFETPNPLSVRLLASCWLILNHLLCLLVWHTPMCAHWPICIFGNWWIVWYQLPQWYCIPIIPVWSNLLQKREPCTLKRGNFWTRTQAK